MEKSPDAFRTISETAEELDVPQHVLRFWETRFLQIKPMKRAGGRRYYRPADVDLIKGIRGLLYNEGYTIRGVQKILKAEGAAYVCGVGRGEIVPRKGDTEGEVGASSAVAAGPPEPGQKIEVLRFRLEAKQRDMLRAALRDLEQARKLLGG